MDERCGVEGPRVVGAETSDEARCDLLRGHDGPHAYLGHGYTLPGRGELRGVEWGTLEEML